MATIGTLHLNVSAASEQFIKNLGHRQASDKLSRVYDYLDNQRFVAGPGHKYLQGQALTSLIAALGIVDAAQQRFRQDAINPVIPGRTRDYAFLS